VSGQTIILTRTFFLASRRLTALPFITHLQRLLFSGVIDHHILIAFLWGFMKSNLHRFPLKDPWPVSVGLKIRAVEE
jgi:hypothetical protein